MLVLIGVIIAMHYLVEVHLGSSRYDYDPEIGLSPRCCSRSTVGLGEFWSRVGPFLLGGLGLSLFL